MMVRSGGQRILSTEAETGFPRDAQCDGNRAQESLAQPFLLTSFLLRTYLAPF